jgi:anti-anti-sigma regulatory factor
MLKISLIENSTHCRVVVEGRIIGAGVKELKTLCTRLTSELKVRALVIDIKNVVLISQEGENALLRFINQGAKLGTEGVLAKCIVQQLAHRSKRQISDLVEASAEHITTDEEIISAIRYLDPDRSHERNLDPRSERSVKDNGTALAICVSLLILLLGGMAYIWLYLRTI